MPKKKVLMDFCWCELNETFPKGLTNTNNFVKFIENNIIYFVIFSDEGSVVSALSLGLNIL